MAMIFLLKYSLLVLASLSWAAMPAALSARIEDFGEPPSDNSAPSSESNSSSGAGLIWHPLRATFRPLNRQQPPTVGSRASSSSFLPFPPPTEPLALATSSIENFDAFAAGRGPFGSGQPFQPPATTTTVTSTPAEPLTSTPSFTTTTSVPLATAGPGNTTPAPASRTTDNNNDNDEDQPTRVPLNRFRPTKPPSVDPQSQFAPSNNHLSASASGSHHASSNNQTTYRITSECFECICEASTNCNPNSRCQTSDVRHTRCGMFLISYDQWLETGLSRQLVTREALARDAAADERAFYECVTDRDCAERLMAIYMQRNGRDCDKDGRVDCYDVAAIHQGGLDQCNSESLLESQYWSDFNACFGFGR